MRANYRIGSLPAVNRRRYPFPFNYRHATSAPIGKLIPLPYKEVLPGDTWSFQNISDMVQLTSTFIRPIMDDVFIDTFAFFVPLRILYDDLESVFGDPNPSAYSKPSLSSIPTIMGNDVGKIFVAVGSVGDHLGLPTFNNIDGGRYSVLPFRAFAKIWDEYARNQNVDQEMVVQTGGFQLTEEPNTDPWSPTNYSGMLPPVSRFHDYFSTMLLAPQKGPAVRIPGFAANLPVITGTTHFNAKGPVPLHGDFSFAGALPSGTTVSLGSVLDTTGISVFDQTVVPVTASGDKFGSGFNPTNLWTQTGDVSEATISSLRTAFQIQKYYERDALYGSRYREYIYAAYGVETDDASLQIPQLLAHGHHRLDITSVASTSDAVSGDTQTYPVGQFAGSSKTLNSGTMRFTKSFTEHGYLFFCFCIRYKHLYSQGIDKAWMRTDRNDFYDPLFANLSMQAVSLDEIYGEDENFSDSVIGYQEAWAEYRTFLSSVSGEMRPNPVGNGIGQYWSLADFFTSKPSLLDIVHETDEPWKRVLSVDPAKQDPFIVDFGFKGILAQVVPYYSTPGYVDHH